MKRTAIVLICIWLLTFTVSLVQAQGLGITIDNLVHGNQIPDCGNFIIKFTPALDGAELYDVRLYANGAQIDRIRSEPWEAEWKNMVAGYYEVYARIEDKNDVEAFSDTIGIIVGEVEPSNILANSGFNCSTAKWTIQSQSGASHTFNWVEDADISIGGAASVEIESGGTLDWHIQMFQNMPLDSLHTYEIWFVAETPEPKAIGWGMQENGGDWTVHGSEYFTVDGNNIYGPYEFFSTVNDPRNQFKFYLGNNTVPIMLDDIVIFDSDVVFPEAIPVTGIDRKDNVMPFTHEMLESYPNPFNSTTVIEYSLSRASDVKLEIKNIRGELVKTLVQESLQPGQHQCHWNGTSESGSSMPSGSYIAQLTTRTGGRTRIRSTKLMLVE